MKIVKWAALVVVVVLIVGGIVLYLNLNRIIRSTVERETASSTNLQTQLGAANLSLFGGRLSLTDLQLGSPEGYQAPRMFTMQDASVSVSYRQLRGDPIHIAGVTLDGPRLVVEQTGGRFNLQAVIDQFPDTDPDEEPIRLVIDRLRISNAAVVLRPGLPRLAEEITVTIPAIELEGIGTADDAQNGAAIREVVMQVLGAMAARASESDLVPPELRQLLDLNVAEMAQRLGAEVEAQLEQVREEVRREVEGVLEDVVEDPRRAVEDPRAVEQRLRGLLDRDRDRDRVQPVPEPPPAEPQD